MWKGRLPPWVINDRQCHATRHEEREELTSNALGWPGVRLKFDPRFCRVKPHPFGIAHVPKPSYPEYPGCANGNDCYVLTRVVALDVTARVAPLIGYCEHGINMQIVRNCEGQTYH